MSVPLLLSGSLSEKAVLRFLRSPAAQGCIVVEFDTLLDRRLHPQVGHWFGKSEIVDATAAREVNEHGRSLLASFLEERPELGDSPKAAALRRACLRVQDQQIVIPHLVNARIAAWVMGQFPVSRIIAAAGCGISFPFWRQTAARLGLPLDLLPVENTGWNPRRRLEKWLFRTRRKIRAAEVQLTQVSAPAPPITQGPLVVCASERVTRLLHGAAGPEGCRLVHVSQAQLAKPTEAELAGERTVFSRWWTTWQQKVPALDGGLSEVQAILEPLGRHLVETSCPLYACLKKRALEELRALKPALLLCDTQTDSPERVWSLAAQELGIPVAAYTYDHFVDPKLNFAPDHLLCDSARGTRAATGKGFPAERIIEVQSHRRPRLPELAPAASVRPCVLFSDSFNTAMNAVFDAQSSLRFYRLIIATARRLPEVDFVIKFHPLRGRKTELLSFAGMDENDLQFRKNYLRTLRPPRNVSLLAPESSMADALGRAAVLLNGYSTTAHEAFQAGVPVVFLIRPDPAAPAFPDIDRFLEVLFTTDAAALTDILTHLTKDVAFSARQVAGQRRYLDELYWKPAPPLAEAVSRLVRALPQSP